MLELALNKFMCYRNLPPVWFVSHFVSVRCSVVLYVAYVLCIAICMYACRYEAGYMGINELENCLCIYLLLTISVKGLLKNVNSFVNKLHRSSLKYSLQLYDRVGRLRSS